MSDCWKVTPEYGFLIHPDPIRDLRPYDTALNSNWIAHLESLAFDLPDLIANGQLWPLLDALPVYDFAPLAQAGCDPRITERLHMLYTMFANAYIHLANSPLDRIPAGLAVPLVQISDLLGRPPIMSYTANVLNNWRRLDEAGDLSLENLDIIQTFTHLYDERWFFMVHAAIEARAGRLLKAIVDAISAVTREDVQTVLDCLREVRIGLVDVVKIFHRMPEHCDPDIYYQHVRRPLFGLNRVIFEGVTKFEGKPQSYMGGSGAQSSIIPAVIAALGIKHQASQLMHYLAAIRSYMPQEHQQFIASITTDSLRDFCKTNLLLQDAYNHCLHQMMTFRRAHFYYARTYIFEKSTEPVGTGGTAFMDFLNLLIRETEAQLL